MINNNLDQQLLEIIKSQQSPTAEIISPHDPRYDELLETFLDNIISPIDVFYVLNSAKYARDWCIDETFEPSTEVYFEPHFFDYNHQQLTPHSGHSLEEVISVKKENLDTNNFALMIDDCWASGHTTKKTIAYLEHIGYQREKIFVFHYRGSGIGSGIFIQLKQFTAPKFGLINENPVLLSATTMLDFFEHPEKYH